MKKWFLIMVAVATFATGRFSMSEAATLIDSPFPLQSPDQTLTLTVTDLGNGIDHGVVFFNHVTNTATAVALDNNGNPDNAGLGISYLAADFNATPVALFSSADESTNFTSPYPAQAPDQLQVLTSSDLNHYNHGVIYFNNAAKTAMAVVLDPNGVPDNFLVGFAILAADFNTPPGTVWGTRDGIGWNCISGCPQ